MLKFFDKISETTANIFSSDRASEQDTLKPKMSNTDLADISKNCSNSAIKEMAEKLLLKRLQEAMNE